MSVIVPDQQMLQVGMVLIRVASSMIALIAPVVTVTYPSGQMENLGAALILLVIVPGATPHAVGSLSQLVLVSTTTWSLLVLALSPLIPTIIRYSMGNRGMASSHLLAVISVLLVGGTMAVSFVVLRPPLAPTTLFWWLYGILFATFLMQIRRRQ